jgi:hypothetical protein
MRLAAPFDAEPEEVFKAEHRIRGWQSGWGAEGGTLMLTQRERIRRWRYTWLLDVDKGTSRLWFDLNERDSYASPGYPLPSREKQCTSVAGAPPTRATGLFWTCAV